MRKPLMTTDKRLVKEYAEFSTNLDKVVSKLGITKANAMLKRIVDRPASQATAKYRDQALTDFVKSHCAKVFALDKAKLLTSNIPEYRDARMACYMVLRKFTNRSYGKIAEDFLRNKRHVMYYCLRCEEDFMSIPQFHKTWMKQYEALETGVVNYLIELEDDGKPRQ